MDRLSELLGDAVQFQYTCLDRIVLNGYLERLQRPENIVYFFREVVGIPCIEPAVLAERTARYRAWVEQYTRAQGIPIVVPPRGARKEDLARGYYDGRLGPQPGIACVLASLETSRTFISYAPTSGNPSYRHIGTGRKRFLHYYWYVQDPLLGRMSLRVATYLPFTITCYLNGHHYLAEALHRAGISATQADNALLAVAEPGRLAELAAGLTPELLRERCDAWAAQLAPRFSLAERQALHLRYRYSVAQIELATDTIVRSGAPLTALFQRSAELGVLVGGAERTAQVFGRAISRRYRGKLQTVLERRDEGYGSLRSSYRTSFVKQYQKTDTLLRTETCLNDTRHLGIGRRLEHLPTLVARMGATTQRFQDLQAELLASAVDRGDLAKLGQPVLVGKRRVPGLRLQDERLIRLLETLLEPGTFVADWTTRELQARVLRRHHLAEDAYRLSQLRYDLGKLRAHGLVERLGRTRRYRLTARGLKLGVLLVKLRTRLLGPLVSLAVAPTPPSPTANPSQLDAALRQVDAALDHLCELLGLRAA